MVTTTEDEAQLEKAQAEQIIADTPMFDGVKHVTVELGNDHDGDPAMWVFFYLDPTLVYTDDWHTRFNQFKNVLSMRIIDRGIQRFPYCRLRTA